jgi:SAM-dependent methyltransferase
MTALSPDQSRFFGGESNQAREMAESFGTNAERYDRARPSYPDDLVQRILAASPGRDVLDVGCGTGILARQFQALGATVLGVDPDARMADLARQRGLEVEVAKFEDWDPAGRAFDVVIAGQAWHWVDQVVGATKAAQVLRPGGLLALLWNAFEPPADLAEAFAAPDGRALPGSPTPARPGPGAEAYPGLVAGLGAIPCARAVDGMEQAGAFDGPEQWQFGWDRHYTRDEYLDQLPTASVWSLLSPAAQQEVLRRVGAAVDAAGGSFIMHYVTVAVAAARTGAA